MRITVACLMGLTLAAGCVASGNVPGHNHPDGARRTDGGASEAAAGTGLSEWRVVVGGAT